MKLNKLLFGYTLLFACMFLVFSCSDDDGGGTDPMTETPISSFQFEPSATDFLTVSFSNFSQNATSYAWDFGDNGSSTEESPTYTYAEAGEYTVELTASNGSESASSTKMITITDPNEAAKLLTGETSKTWKLFREGTSMSLGPNADDPAQWWSGLTNDGSRPCLYEQEFTFSADGTYQIDDKGMFWGEFGVFNNVDGCTANILPEDCYDTATTDMINACGDDVSAWGAGTHQFTYDSSTGELTLTGEGAYIGIGKLGTTGADNITPQSAVSTQISIESFTGYDVMTVEFDYGDAGYWPIRYASYSDPSLEPEVETEEQEFGEDLPDVTPTELFRTFASNDAADWALLDTIPSGSGIEYGVDDPADATAAKVGLFTRTDAQFQELQFQTAPDKMDITFNNFTTVSLDVYLPSSNTYNVDGLSRAVLVGLADRSKTEQWWLDLQQYGDPAIEIALDEWVTLTFSLDSPDAVSNPANGANPFERNDYDMVYINIGGGNHTETGTFYVRNLIFD